MMNHSGYLIKDNNLLSSRKQVLSSLKSFFTQKKTHYTQATSKCRIQLECETPLSDALVEDTSYSIVKINSDG